MPNSTQKPRFIRRFYPPISPKKPTLSLITFLPTLSCFCHTSTHMAPLPPRFFNVLLLGHILTRCPGIPCPLPCPCPWLLPSPALPWLFVLPWLLPGFTLVAGPAWLHPGPRCPSLPLVAGPCPAWLLAPPRPGRCPPLAAALNAWPLAGPGPSLAGPRCPGWLAAALAGRWLAAGWLGVLIVRLANRDNLPSPL